MLLACLAKVFNAFCVKAFASAGLLGQGALGTFRNVELLVEVRRVGIRLFRLWIAKVESLVHKRPAGQVVPVHKGHCHALAASTARASNAVQVRLLVFRALVVDDVSDVINVNAACCNIRCHKNVDLA